MRKSKVLVLTTCLVLMVSLFSIIGIAQAVDKEVKLTFFNTSAEVNKQLEELFKVYHEKNPNVTIDLIPTPIGGQQIQKFQSLLASDNPATMVNLDPGTIYAYKNKFLNLKPYKDKYKKISQPGAIKSALLDGKFLGIPYTVQGYGLLYNKTALKEILGKSFDPKTIDQRKDLRALFKKIEAEGVSPVIIHGADWSLGAHYMGLVYSLQYKDVSKNREFVEKLKEGKVDLTENEVFNGLVDTFDLLKKYNDRKNDPLVADYNKDSLDFAKGRVPFYFMGDWIWSMIGNQEGIDKEFGLCPCPISNDPDDYGNTQIAASQPKFLAIDDSGSTKEQQEAAEEFIYWLLTSKIGQKYLVKEMGFNMPYKDVKVESTNVPARSTSKYIERGKTIDISVINYFPTDYWSKTGKSVQKYLAGVIDREALADEIENYWQSVK